MPIADGTGSNALPSLAARRCQTAFPHSLTSASACACHVRLQFGIRSLRSRLRFGAAFAHLPASTDIFAHSLAAFAHFSASTASFAHSLAAFADSIQLTLDN
jgi:hypothetical protein